MCSEEVSIWLRFGRPEIDWRLPRPGEKSMYDSIGMPARLAQVLPWGAVQNSHWAQGAAGILPMGILDGQVAPDNPMDNERWIAAAVPMYMDKAPPPENRVDYVLYTFQEMEQLKDLKISMNTYVNESMALFIVGQKNIERDWDSYIQELEKIGLKRYLEITQSGYDRASGKKK
jgi:putative aldouronate transport system substrate-binding protein